MARIFEKCLGVIILIIGLLIMGLWLFDQQYIHLLNSSRLIMVFNASACFIFSACAILTPESHSASSRIRLAAGLLLLIFPGCILAQDVLDKNFGIDELFVHLSFPVENQRYGRMAPPTAVCFMLCGSLLMLMQGKRSYLRNSVIQVLAISVMGCAIIGIAATAVRFELLYNWYKYGRMSVSTAICFLLLSMALWVGWYRREMLHGRYAEKAERRISITGIAIISGVALSTGLAVFGIMTNQVERTLDASLSETYNSNLRLVENEFDLGISGALPATTRLLLNRNLILLNENPDNDAVRAVIEEDAQSFINQNLTALAIYSKAGRRVVQAGIHTTNAELDIPLNLKDTKSARLLWKDGPILQLALDIVENGNAIGSVLVEKKLPHISDFLIHEMHLGNTAETRICYAIDLNDMQCLPSWLRPAVAPPDARVRDKKSTSMDLALKNLSGLRVTQDYRDHQVVTVYGPIGKSGLGMVVKIDAAEFYGPIRSKLEYALCLGALLSAIGIIIQRLQLIPIIARLVSSEERVKNINRFQQTLLDAADFTIIACDAKGVIQVFNKTAERVLGYTAEEIVGKKTPALFHDPDLIRKRAQELSKELGREIKPGIETFIAKARIYGRDTHEWSYRRRDGSSYPVLLSVSCLYDAKGEVTGSLGIGIDISDRKVAEVKLLAAAQLKQIVLDSSVMSIIASDVEGNVHTYNKGAERMLGYTAEEFIGRLTVGVIHDAKEVEQRAVELTQELKIPIKPGLDVFVTKPRLYGHEETEWTYIHKSGRRFPVRLSVSPMRDANGAINGYMGIAQDITEEQEQAKKKKLTEDMLRQSEERLHLATTGTSDGLWDWNVLTGDVYYSPRFMQEIGYAENEMPYTIATFTQLLHPDDRDYTFQAVKAAHEHMAPYNIDYRLQHKNGDYIWCNSRGNTVWDGNDKPIRMIGFLTNIDKRKSAEEAFQKAHKELNLIFNHVNAKIWFKDDKNNILRLNKSAAEAMGGRIEDFENRNTSEIFPDFASKYLEDDLNIIRKGFAKLGIFEKIVLEDGSTRWMSSDKIPYYDDLLGTKGVLVVSTDITDLKESEEQREQLVAKLTDSNTELERFAYVASHDMQEPLRMIANFAMLIGSEYGDKLDEEGQQYVKVLTESAVRMQNMVQDLLEYARVGSDTTLTNMVDGNDELKHVLENLSSAIKESGASVTYDPLPCFKGNAVQFMRLMQNLIGNGMKYQKKGNKPKIQVRLLKRPNDWEISVHDNGIGMEESHIEQIFEPFKRLHTWQEYHGTGIGLAVCKKIVENLGGTISAKSKPGKGSIFAFTIPKALIN